MTTSKAAVFLDRDGVINPLIYYEDASIVDSPFTLRQFTILPKVPKAIRLLNDLGLPVVIVSNQPGIAKRHFRRELLAQTEKKLWASLHASGAKVDGIYYCLHHPNAEEKSLRRRCRCRKPQIGMLTRAARDLNLSLTNSYMVGDGLTDIQAGARAECTTILLGRWKCEHCQLANPPGLRPDFCAEDLWEAANLIKGDIQLARMRDLSGLSA
jgi:D-glycero-D-manno-heptose 1,7-bisphosphate phosphatase